MDLSPDLLAQIQQAINNGSLTLSGMAARQASPFKPRQLHDLRLLPTADDPRPTFFWSAVGPRDDPEANKTHPYPRLLWAVDGTEICVRSKSDHDAKLAEGYVEVDPGLVAPDPMADMRIMLASLSPADRDLVVNGAKRAQMQAIQEQLAEFSADDLEALVGGLPKANGTAKKSA